MNLASLALCVIVLYFTAFLYNDFQEDYVPEVIAKNAFDPTVTDQHIHQRHLPLVMVLELRSVGIKNLKSDWSIGLYY